MRAVTPSVYILASQRNGTLYIGVTGDLVKRIWEHRNNTVTGFTNRHAVHDLVSTKYTRIWLTPFFARSN
ncbi:MAG: GIY-YIG nuclease family protein [Rhodanobacteraceae bacterium]